MKKYLSLLLIMVLAINITSIASYAIEPPIAASVLLDKVPDRTDLVIDTRFSDNNERYVTLNYSFSPQSFDAPQTDIKDKEVVMVFDASGSMRYDMNDGSGKTRIVAAQDAAKTFLGMLEGNKHVDVAYVSFSHLADVVKLGNDNFRDMEDASDYTTTFSTFSNLPTDGATNVGDGVRVARYLLDKNTNSNVEKYIILLTDGITNRRTQYEDTTNTSGSSDTTTGNGSSTETTTTTSTYGNITETVTITTTITDNGNTTTTRVETTTERKNNRNGSTSTSRSVSVSTTSTGSSNIAGWEDLYEEGVGLNVRAESGTELAIDYAKEVSRQVPENYNSTYIAFADASAGSSLSQIAAAGGDTYLYANSSLNLEEQFANFAAQVNSDYVLKNVYFEETIPNEFEIVEVSNGLSYSGQVVSGMLGTNGLISYRLSDDGTQYVADPISFSIKLKATQLGDYTIGEDAGGSKTAFVRYNDFDENETVRTKWFDKVEVSVGSVGQMSDYFTGVTITPDKTQAYLSDTVKVDYELTGDNISISSSIISTGGTTKDIMMVFDTSNSMSWPFAGWSFYKNYERLTAAKKAAKDFIEGFDGKNVNIGLINFDEYATVNDFGGSTFLSMADVTSGNKTQLDNRITSLSLRGGTNTGDALRKAYHELAKRDASHDKYVVLLTDGEPWYWESTSGYPNGGILSGVDLNGLDYYLDDSDLASTTIKEERYSDRYDITEPSQKYAVLAAEQIKNDSILNIKPYTILLSDNYSDKLKMQEVSLALGTDNVESGRNYYLATESLAVGAAYDAIQNDIADEIPVANVTFTHQVPLGLTILKNDDASDKLPAGLTYDASSRTITGLLNGVKLDKQNDGTYKVSSSSGVEIEYGFEMTERPVGTTPSTYDVEFPMDSVTISYTKVDGNTDTMVGGNDPIIDLLPTVPTIDPITGDNTITSSEASTTKVKGETDPEAEVTVVITEEDGDGNPDNDKVISTVTTTADANGDYETEHDIVNPPAPGSPALDPTNNVKATATVKDKEGDTSSADQVAERKAYEFINNITIVPSASSLTSGQSFTLTYTLKGSEVILDNTWMANSYSLTIDNIQMAVPLSVTVDKDAFEATYPTLSYDDATGIITGNLSATIKKIGSNKYTLEDEVVVVPASAAINTDIAIPMNSVTVNYTDKDSSTYSYVGGNAVDIPVAPTPPIIDPVTGDDIIQNDDKDKVYFTGKVEAGVAEVYVELFDTNDAPVAGFTAVTVPVTYDGSDYVFRVPTPSGFYNMSSEAEGYYKVKATAKDADGDQSLPAERKFLKMMSTADLL